MVNDLGLMFEGVCCEEHHVMLCSDRYASTGNTFRVSGHSVTVLDLYQKDTYLLLLCLCRWR